jgi:antitoxin ParD1/3/4
MASSFSLGDHFDAFVKEQLASGRYTNASEVIRAGLRLLEEYEDERLVRAIERAEKIEWLKGEIQKGIDSGPSIPAEEVFANSRARIAKRHAERANREAA